VRSKRVVPEPGERARRAETGRPSQSLAQGAGVDTRQAAAGGVTVARWNTLAHRTLTAAVLHKNV
jgi:hypothetical protein